MATEVVKVVDPDGTGDYTSLGAFEAAEQRNLVTADEIAVAKCQCTGGTADTTAFVINGWTTDATRYIKMWTDTSESYRHNGTYQTGNHYRLEISNNIGINVADDVVLKIEGLQFKVAATNSAGQGSITVGMSGSSNPDVYIEKCVFKGLSGNTQNYVEALQVFNTTAVECFVFNNIFYDYATTLAYGGAIGNWDADSTVWAIHNTAYNGRYGYFRNNGPFTVYDCVGFDNVWDFYGSFVYSDYNCSNAVTPPGSHSFISLQTASQVFADPTNRDLHIKDTSSDLYDAGSNSGSVSDDIDGETRTRFDIGADEYSTGGLSKSIAEALTFAESLSQAVATWHQILTEEMGLSETLANELVSAALQKTIVENMGFAEALKTTIVWLKSIEEDISLGEQLSSFLKWQKKIAEDVSMKEVFNSSLRWLQSISEDMGLSESLDKSLRWMKSISEDLGLAESPSFVLTNLESISESMTLNETLLHSVAKWYKILTENISMSEALAYSLIGQALSKSITENATLDETLSHEVARWYKRTAENIVLQETLSHLSRWYQDITEDVTMSESLSHKVAKWYQQTAEDITLQETLSRLVKWRQNISEDMLLGESLSHAVAKWHKQAVENIVLQETLSHAAGKWYQTVSENMGMGESLSYFASAGNVYLRVYTAKGWVGVKLDVLGT